MRSKAATHRAGFMIKPQVEHAEMARVGDVGSTRVPGAHRKPADGRQMWSIFAVAVVAAAVIASVAILLLLRADPGVRQNAPVPPTPASTATVTGPASPPAESVPPVAPPPVTETPAVETTRATVRPAVPPTPTLAPTTVVDEPEATMPQSPTTRAPLSVAPETRPPFPHQAPPTGGDNRGGLLGGGGLL